MEAFDLKLAQECAASFAGATDLGCVVSDLSGKTMASYGYSCDACGICTACGNSKLECTHSQLYGMTEAERFGGKYIYYCPMGLTCFVSPILGEVHSAAKITVGPFLMIEQEDYIDCELDTLAQPEKNAVIHALKNIPTISPTKTQKLSTLLFMSVGFMNKVSANNRLLEMQAADAMQGEISTYIAQLKTADTPPPYPIATETVLLKSIASFDKETSLRLLNELMGHILFSSGHHFEMIKSRILELLTLIGRAAITAGASPDQTLILCHQARCTIQTQQSTENLCLQLSKSTTQLMDSVFQHLDSRHANAIHRCIQYIELNYYSKIALEQLAQMVYLSPTYLSRIFREETGVTFSTYLNQVRINKAKALLHHDDLRLTDIAIGIGFEDQSYFTKVFKRLVGVTPLKYRAQLQSGEQAYW